MTLNSSGTLRRVAYSFLAVKLRSTLTRSSRTCYVQIDQYINMSLSKFPTWNLIIFITKDIRTTVFILVLTTFQPICRSAFFPCFMSKSETLNWTLYLIQWGDCFYIDQVQVQRFSKYLLLFTCSWDRICNLQIILLGITFQLNANISCVMLDNLEGIFGTYKTNVSINLWDPTNYLHERFLL